MSKNILYDEDGDFRVGAILADNETSLQVEAPHGKRSKVKASYVLLRFEDARLGEFLSAARQLASTSRQKTLFQTGRFGTLRPPHIGSCYR